MTRTVVRVSRALERVTRVLGALGVFDKNSESGRRWVKENSSPHESDLEAILSSHLGRQTCRPQRLRPVYYPITLATTRLAVSTPLETPQTWAHPYVSNVKASEKFRMCTRPLKSRSSLYATVLTGFA